MKKVFKVSLNGKTAINLDIEGDDELVENFLKMAITDSFGAFYRTKEIFGQMFIDGIKSEIQIVQRDTRGHFIKPKTIQKPEGRTKR